MGSRGRAFLLVAAFTLAPFRAAPAEDPAPQPAARPAAPPAFGPEWSSLLGEWKGEGSGGPGSGRGVASFHFDLERRVLVRRSRTDFPASKDRPATHHQDLLVISPGASPREGNATCWDNEGHVIAYTASWSADGKVLTFVSPSGEAKPGFQLVYTATAPDTMTVSFAVAAPGTSDFKTYVSGVTRRTGRP